ncbi:hypothetical protein [Corynebacterium glyciniphilum]|uniref:hypothetical protein n=1 Tax=Corynebacterium glyciniphilum TaxID=1404244 RepID=UPI00264E8389|nr:hypothetical protein [Corynebacterium glyciniphilum]MDN5682456.1 hypothetical protein [Corynebacterium glyciniphilum]MDN6706855.1 hypothetical protein [Corynebacterium glyciniphilum]
MSQQQSKNPLWFIAPFVVSIVVLFSGDPGWALVLHAVALVAAAVAHSDLPFKRTAVGVIIAAPIAAVLLVLAWPE